MGPNKNTRGSLWCLFSKVTGVENPNATSLRRASEAVVQANPSYAARSDDIQGHCKETGAAAYHKTADEIRAQFAYNQYKKEGPKRSAEDSEVDKDDVGVTPSKQNKVDDIDEEDVEEDNDEHVKKIAADDDEHQKRLAIETLIKAKERKKRNVPLGKGLNLLPEDKATLQQLLSSEKYAAISKLDASKKLPGMLCTNSL